MGVSAEVVAAIITASGGLLAAVAAAMIPMLLKARARARNAEEKAKKEQATAVKVQVAAVKAVATLAERLPYSVERVQTTVAVGDVIGGGTIQREIIGIRLRRGQSLGQYVTRLRTSGAFNRLHPIKTENNDIGKGVTIKHGFAAPDTCIVVVDFIPFLADSDPPLNLCMTARTSSAQLLKRADITKAYAQDDFKYEYVAEAIECEVDELRLEVQFPPGSRPKTFPMVFRFSSEEMATEQLANVPQVDESVPDRASLTITKPAPSLCYAIYWIGLE